MPLRTPRRRISPRTKRRYRAIRNFFRKTLGSTASQPDIKINSSIAVNVTDLKHKIVGIEHQLDEVSKHCRDLASYDNISRRDIESLSEQNGLNASKRNSFRDRKQVVNETKILYKSSESKNRTLDDSASVLKLHNDSSVRDQRSADEMNYQTYISNQNDSKIIPKKSLSKRDIDSKNFSAKNTHSRKHKTQAECDDFSVFGRSYHSLNMPRVIRHQAPDYPIEKHGRKEARREAHGQHLVRDDFKYKEKSKRHKSASPARLQENERGKSKKKKPVNVELDQDFIADIIKRQYKPVKVFGRRDSDLSQMSSPVCRDQEYAPNTVLDEVEQCSCCHPARFRHPCIGELSDAHSFCDAQLYSARRRARSRRHRQYLDVYNDSNYYDVVPVKEKSSPKSRKKFVEDNILHYDNLREVPPSPTSNRPRLNLRAQNYNEYEDSAVRAKHERKRRSPYQKRRPRRIDTFRSDLSSEESDRNEPKEFHPNLVIQRKNAEIQEDMGTMSSLQYSTFANDKTNAILNTSLNKTHDTESNIDKTDKALCEIKDILQSFLQEIKKESTASQCEKSSDATAKTSTKQLEGFQRDSTKAPSCILQNNNHNGLNNFGLGQCSMPAIPPPYLPGFANPCCYPVVPMCPMNCVQNGYLLTSPSFTCQGCANQKDSDDKQNNSDSKENNTTQTNNAKKCNETETLIREIYNYVANNSNARTKEPSGNNQMYSPRGGENTETGILTSRSVGKSSRTSKHDANVGTLPLKCYSKSCEAIGTRIPSEAFCSRTNASYSDTILEKLSLEATTQSTTVSESSEPTAVDKTKKSKFANVLRSFGLLKKNKKNKKDAIEELSESESTIEVEMMPKQKHPFRQNVTNYMMHRQDYYHPPPAPRHDRPLRSRHRSPPHYHDSGYSPFDSQINGYSNSGPVNHQYGPYPEDYHGPPPHYGGPACMHSQASAPPYPNPYEPHCSHNMQPQVPLCLKEIEVKSIGTQSEKKMPFFRMFSQRVQSPARNPRTDAQNTGIATQTSQSTNKPGFFNWKELQAKAAPRKFPDLDPIAYSLKAQKQLAEGDNKMRNAMLKKLFYKRNPFSPRNLIVRTLLGRDKSSWGVPPPNMIQRPRMFV